jgi:hypothetical protein
MIVTSQTSTVKSSGVQVSNAFSIAKTPHMFNILSSGLYSDKIAAVLREVGCNAHDAHVTVGKKHVPIEVKLPSALDKSFYVKDFGPGLSDENLRRMYTTYGWSDKQSDNNVTGGFGLGSKSPFAYTGQFEGSAGFTITSVHNGVERSYAAHLDDTGTPSISRLGESPASPEWPSGLKVAFEVKADDIREFYEKALLVYRWFETTPVILGVEAQDIESAMPGPEEILSDKPLAYLAPAYNFRGPSNDGCIVVMGGVAYPLVFRDLGSLDGSTRQFLNAVRGGHGLVVHLPIGSVPVTPSRESLQLTKEASSHLIEVLTLVCKNAERALYNKLQQMPGETKWEFLRRAFARVGGYLLNWADVNHSALGSKIKALAQSAYAVPLLPLTRAESTDGYLPTFRYVSSTRRRGSYSSEVGAVIQGDLLVPLNAKKLILAYEDCRGYLSGLKRYVANNLQGPTAKLVLISGPNFVLNQKYAEMLAAPGGALEGAETMACSSVKPAKTPKAAKASVSEPVARRPKKISAAEFYADEKFLATAPMERMPRVYIRYGDIKAGTAVFAVTPDERADLTEFLQRIPFSSWNFEGNTALPSYWVNLTAAEAKRYQIVEQGHLTFTQFKKTVFKLLAGDTFRMASLRNSIREGIQSAPYWLAGDGELFSYWDSASKELRAEIEATLRGTPYLEALHRREALRAVLLGMEEGKLLEEQDAKVIKWTTSLQSYLSLGPLGAYEPPPELNQAREAYDKVRSCQSSCFYPSDFRRALKTNPAKALKAIAFAATV